MVGSIMWPTGRLHTELDIYRLSHTRQRDEVYLAIGRLGPVRPADLALALSGQASKRTVYRTVKAFKSALIIRELTGGMVELSPPFRHQHYFIICTGCGRRTGFWDEVLEAKLNRILERRRYVLPAHQVELSGLCPLCAQKI